QQRSHSPRAPKQVNAGAGAQCRPTGDPPDHQAASRLAPEHSRDLATAERTPNSPTYEVNGGWLALADPRALPIRLTSRDHLHRRSGLVKQRLSQQTGLLA